MSEGYSWGQSSRALRRQGANPQPMGRVFCDSLLTPCPLGLCAQPLCVTDSTPLLSRSHPPCCFKADSRSFLSPLPDPLHLHSAHPLNLASRWEPGPLPHRAPGRGDRAPNQPSPLTGKTVGCGGSRSWPGTNYVPDTFPDTHSLLRISLTL